MKHKSSKAVTFMELLIAVIITGLLAGVAIPSYTQTLRENRRQDAIQALRDGKAKIEQYIVANSGTIPASLAIAGLSSSTNKAYYTISYQTPNPITGAKYTLTATAGATQSDDVGCLIISISELYDDTQPSTCK
jgi:type IV pilus assembly protein PilE